MTREEAVKRFQRMKKILSIPNSDAEITIEAIDMAIEALSSDAIAKAYNQGFVEGSVNATVNSNYICPRCGEKMERRKE